MSFVCANTIDLFLFFAFIYFFFFFLISFVYIFIYRSRLSLDLSSPTSTRQLDKHFTIQFYTNRDPSQSNNLYKSPTFSGLSKNNDNKRVIKSKSNNNIISPSRYTEFKTFNSAFDGLQALEKSNNNNNISINKSNSNNNINNNISDNGSSSMGVVPNLVATGGTNTKTSTTTSIMINCGGVGANNATSPSMVNNSNISTVLLNSSGNGLVEGMTPLSRSASLPIKAPSLSSGKRLFCFIFSFFFYTYKNISS